MSRPLAALSIGFIVLHAYKTCYNCALLQLFFFGALWKLSCYKVHNIQIFIIELNEDYLDLGLEKCKKDRKDKYKYKCNTAIAAQAIFNPNDEFAFCVFNWINK